MEKSIITAESFAGKIETCTTTNILTIDRGIFMHGSFVKTLVGSLGLLACLFVFSQANAQQQEPHNAELPKKEAGIEADKKVLVKGGFKAILNDFVPPESIESIEVWFDDKKYWDKSIGRNSKFDFNERVKSIQDIGNIKNMAKNYVTHSIINEKKQISFIVDDIGDWDVNKVVMPVADAEDFYMMMQIKSKTNIFEIFFIKHPYSDALTPQSVPFFIKNNKNKMYEKYIIEIKEGEFMGNLPFFPWFN